MNSVDRLILDKTQTEYHSRKRRVGIKLPLSDHNDRLFNSSYTTEEQAYSNLVNLLLTQRGERLMHPNFGTNILRTVFDQMNDSLPVRIEADINAAVSTWLPYISVNVDVNPADENDINEGHLLSIIVEYSINNTIANVPIVIYVTELGTLTVA